MTSAVHVEVATRRLEEIEPTLAAAFGANRVAAQDPDEVALRVSGATTGGLSAMAFQLRAVADATLDQLDAPFEQQTFLTGVRVDGRFALSGPDRGVDLSAPFLYPEVTAARIEWAHIRTLAIRRSTVIDRARVLTGSEQSDLRFTDAAPSSSPLGHAWVDLMGYADQVLDAGTSTMLPEAVLAGLEALIADGLLRTFPNTAVDPSRSAGSASNREVRRAARFIDDNAHRPIRLADIAAAVNLSPRGLQAAFRRVLDTTPMAYLQRARLAGVRRALLAADPATTTVAEVAHSWGVLHLGRFAATYRDLYDELPHITLQREP